MELVIKIDEEQYEFIKESITMDKVKNYHALLYAICEHIKNGIPLPKGHGRLIDVDDLLDRIGLEDTDSNREENVGEIITLEDLDFTPTIIEADKAESEDKE